MQFWVWFRLEWMADGYTFRDFATCAEAEAEQMKLAERGMVATIRPVQVMRPEQPKVL